MKFSQQFKSKLRICCYESLASLIVLILCKVLYEAASKILCLVFPLGRILAGVARIKDTGVNAAEAVIGTAGQLTSFYEREKYVHDYILQHAQYDSSDVISAQSAYSALVSGKTVCAGYSKAFQYLMTRLRPVMLTDYGFQKPEDSG